MTTFTKPLIKGIVLAAGAALTLAATSFTASAQQSGRNLVKCESTNHSPRRCYVNTRGHVEIVQRLSDAGCVEGQDWGFDNRSIWVRGGCRAVFAVRGKAARIERRQARQNGQWGNNGNWNNGPVYNGDEERWRRRDGRWVGGPVQRYVDCQSFNNGYRLCQARVRNGAQLVQQLSSDPCIQGKTWGVQAGGIWVNNGCRGTFLVR